VIKIHLYAEGKKGGKPKFPWIQEGLLEYEKRLTGKATFIFHYHPEELLYKKIAEDPSILLLDPSGDPYTSEAFSSLFFKLGEKQGATLSFAIGGPTGFPPSLKKEYKKISLSLLTFPHDLARLLLFEQIYRAFEIEKGSSYHK